MTRPLKLTAGISLLALGITACAGTPDPSPRLLAAEASLAQAKASPQTLEMGRSSLEKADVALAQAKEEYFSRDENDYIHAIRMTEGYTMLAETRGDHKRTEMSIADIKERQSKIQIASQTAAKVQAEAEAARAMAATAAAEARAEMLRNELSAYELKQVDTGMTLILQDLQFPTNSAQLLPGAQQRLMPLAEFLNGEPEARIRIVGHTDAQGADDFNQNLSQRRAQAVGSYLMTQGITDTRIEIAGMGESQPIASNDTAAGRSENRRVEVTILNN